MPRSWVDHFSRRRAAIVRELEDRGENSAKAAQVATLATREPKQLQASEAQLRAAWWRRAQALGVDRYWTEHLLGRSLAKPPDLGELFGELVAGEALTEQTSTFSRRDVLRAVAERLPSGAPVESVEQIADTILKHDPDRVIPLGTRRGQLTALDVIRRADGTVVPAQVDETRYTTRELLLTEQRAITGALRRRDAGVATVDPANVEAVLGRRSMSDEQATMVRQLTCSGHGVEVVVGKAGTGKTYALDAARDAWNRAGIRVTGVALAARAALELQDAAGIPSTTLARLLTQLEADQPGSPLA